MAGIDKYTVLMLHMNGDDESTTFTDDSASEHVITANGNAQIDTAQSKFGGASALFDGSGDYLSIPDSDDWAFGTGSWEIDFWVRFNTLSGWQVIWSPYDDGSSNRFYIGKDYSNRLYFHCSNTVDIAKYYTSSSVFTATNTWYHVALTRNGANHYIFINGVSQTLSYETTPDETTNYPNKTSTAYIGKNYYGHNLNGWLDEFRVSKGIARWTTDFSVPTSAYTESPPDAPTDLTATAVSISQIDLSWTGSDGATGYKIERESPIGGGWSTLIEDTGDTGTVYSDEGLSSNTEYNYRVRALNESGESDPSNTSNDTTFFAPNQLNPSLQWKTISYIEPLQPVLQWKTSAAVKYLPNIVNYPFYFSAPTVQTSEVPLLVSGCPVGFSVHMKDTGSSGQTTIKVYAGGTLRATKTIAASGVSDSYIEYFDLDSVLHPLETFSVEITEVATGAEDLKVNMYLMTFPYKLEEMYYENYFGSQLIHGISSNYLFKSADYWSIEFNQPIGTIISVKAVKDGVEEDVSYEVIDGIYYNNRLKITPSTILPDTLRIILQDVKSDKYTFELKPEFKEYSVTIPDYVTARLASESYGSDLATGGTVSADSEVGGFEASKAFDDNTGTYWNSTTPVANIAYEFPTVKQIQKITIKPYMYGGHSTVKRWILCGSNDATPALDDEDAWSYISGGLVEDSSDTQSFTFTNEYTYKHYRLTVLDNWASTAYTGIYELAMFERSVTFDAVQQFYAYLPLTYYQYSHDGGSTWSDLAAFDSNYLDIDFAGLDSGLRTVKVRLFQTQDYFEDEFQVNYVGGELDCYVEFDGSTFQFFYADEIPFGSLTLYVDDVLNSSISPVMVDGFDTGSFDELSTMTVSDGRFYYQGHVYEWTEDDIDISTLEVEDGENIIVFGFNTNTLEFEVKARLETVQYADFIPIMEGKIVVNYQQFTQITQNPTYVFEPDDYPLDFDEDVSLRVVFEDVTGRTKEFEFDYIKTFYNVWRTLTVTDSEGNKILPGQIHSETTLTYTVTTDEG